MPSNDAALFLPSRIFLLTDDKGDISLAAVHAR
uniref:Uncharacterized protein n=1 Tax=Anguilla anguilla TaxID=7936 RepID=A0A0E9QXD7_ANGAN